MHTVKPENEETI